MYEYKCGCGHVTETLRNLSERDKPIDCEDCGGTDTERFISQTTRRTYRLDNGNRRRAKEENLKEI